MWTRHFEMKENDPGKQFIVLSEENKAISVFARSNLKYIRIFHQIVSDG